MSNDASGADTADALYALLGAPADADLSTLRAAYRAQARRLHPDLRGGGSDSQLAMARVNEAWEILSDPDRRAAYDLTQRRLAAERARAAEAAADRRAATAAGTPGHPNPVLRPETTPAPRFIITRKEAWLDGMAMRIRFLSGFAGRSATQAMLLRHPGTSRESWDAIVPLVCQRLVVDVGERIREARAAGAAPLDLANAACLIGLRQYGDELAGGSTLPWDDRIRHAEMVDRMYATLAYELPRDLVQHLGNSPRVLRRLTGRRR